MELGHLSLILHAHLPFVRHSEHPEFLEEDWLFEALTETYIPLLVLLDSLVQRGVRFRLAMSLTPPLCEMLSDGLLQERYARHLGRLCELAERETVRLKDGREHELAVMYRDWFNLVRQSYEGRYGRDVVGAFRRLQDSGCLEVIACCATHAFLPFIQTPESRRAQVRVGCANYRRHMGRQPRGFWLPECAYCEGVDGILREEGVSYFLLDTHGLLYADPRPRYGQFAPVVTPRGVVAFARDPETSNQVWSAVEGYPGDPMYREFYRDVGYDAPYEYIMPYLHADGLRRNIGIKYHRITGKVALGEKALYDPAGARERAAAHAGNFMFNRQHQVRHWHGALGRKPVIVAPYDAELFGHWWFEGPLFLEYLFLKLHHDQDEVRLVTPSEYLSMGGPLQVCSPNPSSWGAGGFFEVWCNGGNDWIYRHLHMAQERMVAMARSNAGAGGLVERALNQAARELLLAQSSDWPFIMTTGTHVPYAHKRFKEHVNRFNALYEQVGRGAIDEESLRRLEQSDNIFPELNFRVYL